MLSQYTKVTLKSLDLRNEKISKYFSANLVCLDLSYCLFSNDDTKNFLGSLSRFNSLQVLNLTSIIRNYNKQAFKSLLCLTNLRYLSLADNGISSVSDLAQLVSRNPKLSGLDLKFNNFSNVGSLDFCCFFFLLVCCGIVLLHHCSMGPIFP